MNAYDPEVISICEAINLLNPAITTVESCCGHGKRTFKIWFTIQDLEHLPRLLYWFDTCHTGRPGWQCVVYTDCSGTEPTFMLEGPVGEQAYEDAEAMAALIKASIKGEDNGN